MTASNQKDIIGISCVVIGEGNLLQFCLKHLVKSGINVYAVYSNTENVVHYCQENNLLTKKHDDSIEDAFKNKAVDYLFSISNPRIIKKSILDLPKKCSINFHDSPLPKYAGVHATSWAIINGEHKHGISWHIVEKGIDTGDIIQFKDVDILPEDSALTLNLKCHEAAKDTFISLVSQIRNDKIERKKQLDAERSYYGLYAIPPNLGVLVFNTNCEKLYNLGRGLEFGKNENALGCPKVLTSTGHFMIVTNIEISSQQHSLSPNPGTIIDIFDDTIVAATMKRPVLVSIANLDGSQIQPCNYRKYGIAVGLTLSSEFSVDTDLLVPLRKKESFWRRKMARYEATVLFRQRMNVVAAIIDVSTNINLKTVTIPIPRTEINLRTHPPEFVLSVFIAFISRITAEEDIYLGVLAEKRNIPIQAQPLYADICPGIFNINPSSDIKTVIRSLQEDVKKLQESHTFLVDMFYRYPELRGQKRIPHHNIVIGTVDSEPSIAGIGEQVLQDSNILLLFKTSGDCFYFTYSDKPGQDHAHVIDVMQHFPTFLRSINSQNMERPLHDINLVTKEELEALYPIHEWTDDRFENVYETFNQQCNTTPHNVAILSTSESLTYCQSKSRVCKLAAMLDDVKAEERIIGLHLPNSIAYVISVLAVLKTGRAFLPLPLDFPAERLSFTSRDAKVKSVLMTKEKYEISNFEGMPVNAKVSKPVEIGEKNIVLVKFQFDENDNLPCLSTTKGHDFEMPKDVPLSKDVCYVMYTSGSTGRPKGVKVNHQGVLNLAKAQIELWNIRPEDTIAQFASISFDATISEIFTALLSGATLAILRDGERLGQEFIQTMNQLNITIITLAPSALNIYGPNDFPKLKKIITAGEACTLGTAVKWKSGNPDIKFFNAYGPTEATVCATCFEFDTFSSQADVNQDLPIGKAIPGACVYLFDSFLNPVPPNVVGEIYIGGKGVSEGYLGHAKHYNDKRFIQNPLTRKPMQLYKTGDHAFQDISGIVTYIGRMDDMVKIRGQRVDLSEIEQVLIQHPKIEIAVVVLHRCSKSKEISIAAYLAPKFVYISELREYLSKVLPKYMIPTFIKKIEVADFKMTLNGKIDRKALETDESVHNQGQNNGNSHLNDTQLAIAKLWCKILQLDDKAYYDFHRQTSFSELGGNSLQLVLLQRTLEDKLHVRLSFTDIGTADTIEEFSEVIKRKNDILRKSVSSKSQDVNALREIILQDSLLKSNIVPEDTQDRSTQFQYFAAFGKKSANQYPRNVLISGVTGFLGAYLLVELLEKTNAHICCMVRESTEARGLGRIIENLRKYNVWKFAYAPRIAVVISDLSQEHLGIAPDIYKGLCESIDVVFMNAAMMNFNTGYHYHRIANVEGTKEFIKFASRGTQKYLFTTSSLSVFLFPKRCGAKVENKICYESDFFDDPCDVEGGYGQSKWASERLVMQALDYLPGGAIFRPARVSGCSKTGVGPRNDLFASSLLGMRNFGSYPDMNFPYDLTPVDYCAKAMVEIALHICNDQGKHKKVYHLFNNQTMPFCDIFKGMNLQPLPLQDWRKELRNAGKDQKELIPLTPFFLSEFWDRAPLWPVFDTTNTNMLISDDTKQLLKPTRELLEIYLKYFQLDTINVYD